AVVASEGQCLQSLAVRAPRRWHLIWGMGGGRSSSGSAFDRNVETEISAALAECALTVLMGAWKFFEAIVPAALLVEARELGMPLRPVWMLLELYRQPRRLCAFGSISYDVVAWHGVLAGCAHACAMVSLLLHRLLRSIRGLGVVPGALMGDVALRVADFRVPALDRLWAAVTRFREGARELGIIIQRGLKGRCWVWKLGHDLCGRRKVRRQAAERSKALAARGGGLLLFEKFRGKAGLLVGARQGPSSVTVVLATQRAKEFDPVYAATCDLICRCASWARGPVASAILTLRRVGWFVHSSTVRVPDDENHVNLLAESPKDARMHLAMGIERAAVAEGPGAMCLRVHWAGVPWTRQAQLDAKLATWAGSDTPGHRFFGCETLLEPAFLGEEKGGVLPERRDVAWFFVRDQSLNMGGGPQAWGEFALSACLPCMPPSVPPAKRTVRVRYWGDWGDDPGATVGNVVFADGAGPASSMPELRRCGWAAVQAAGRAERRALLQALLVLSSRRGRPAVDVVFADLLGLVEEATSWGAELERAGATHATVRRRLRAQPARPAACWIPAHTQLKQFQEGARARAVLKGYADFCGVEIECHKQVAAYIAWAMRRMLKIPSWQATDSAVRPCKGLPSAPPVAVVRRQLVILRGGRIVLCRRCCRSTAASSGPPRAQHLRSPCCASEVAKLRAESIVEHVGATWVQASAEGSFAMVALCASQGPLGPGDLGEAPSTLWALGDTAVDVQGHRLHRAGPAIFCQVCVAWSGSGASRALLEPCRGLPTGEGRDARTYLSNL
ncbi:unnamed protein product, partial [Prorocentrum cordatum]